MPRSRFVGRTIDSHPKKKSGTSAWRSPSNIALVKYWGKHGRQLPRNPSISMTLSRAFTETMVQYEYQEYPSDSSHLEFYFEGKPNEAFRHRIKTFLDGHIDVMPFLKNVHLSIESRNSFPHSAGIASSASSMSALALCLASIESELLGTEEIDTTKASYISRLASGSACRSVFPEWAVWGQSSFYEGSDDQYAIPVGDYHEIYRDMHDDILIISDHEKSVSSSAGHKLMEDNIYADARFSQARHRMGEIKEHLASGEIMQFGKIVEDEALSLHAMMMCSDPSFILMTPKTLEAIQCIRAYRKENEAPIFFTLDAGPNVHVLYPESIAEETQAFIQNTLGPLCVDGRIIKDQMGQGPTAITEFSL